MAEYIAVTIGPIFDTLSLTSSPVALWAGSYFFSLLSRNICAQLVSRGVAPEEIISPFYEEGNPLMTRRDGVGMFHDRVIFSARAMDLDGFRTIRAAAIRETALAFDLDPEYMERYCMVAAVAFQGTNPILDSANQLNNLELARPFVDREEQSSLLRLFTGDRFSKNSVLHDAPVMKQLTDFRLKKENGGFRSLQDITRTGRGYKKYQYYAILRSDGDNMGKIIASLSGDGEIRQFSRDCMSYCAEVADAVSAFGGVTIYSGGDDLLAILPCANAAGQTPFHFIKEANGIFARHFEKYGKNTSLSFGLTMAYNKFPLYETLDDSAALLFGQAKAEKNCVAFRLQKHSGQSEGLLLKNDFIGSFVELLDRVQAGGEEVLSSATYRVAEFASFFNLANSECEIQNLFDNLFDGFNQQDSAFVHEILPRFYEAMRIGCGLRLFDDPEQSDSATTLSHGLRVARFFREKGVEEE